MLDEIEVEVRSLHHAEFQRDVIAGLSARRKTLPCRWLYDDRGSELFEEITQLPEYYPTRTETSILRANAADIAAFAGARIALLEYGAGAGVKTELVLRALQSPCFYVPIDIAGDFLGETAARILKRFPGLRVRPIVSDFTTDFEIPRDVAGDRRVGFFPGSTIGNLDATQARAFLTRMRRHVGADGAAIVGVDLKKDVRTLVAAYDDRQGVTAEFNLNLLHRINRELDGDFVPELFAHSARWNEAQAAMEMHLVSLVTQTVTIGERSFVLQAGESIHTESSRKYDAESFAGLAGEAGWTVERTWIDDDSRFAVFGLSAASSARDTQSAPRI